MSMSKKDFIALADSIRFHNRNTATGDSSMFEQSHLNVLADFCKEQNPRFLRDRWLGYISGECGPNGGDIKTHTWDVQGNYGQGWETVCSEDSRKEALQRLKEYNENETQYAHRLVRR